ncbi:MAG: S8 family peptidase [Miltoncostaeaceae bacterium]
MARTTLSRGFGRRVLVGLVGTIAAGAAFSGTAVAQAAPTEAERVLVKVDETATPAQERQIERALDAESSEDLGGGWHVYEVDETTLAEARSELAAVTVDETVALDAPLFPAGVPNDPLFGAVSGGYQWALANTGAWGGSVAGADIQAPAAWDAIGTASDVVVAVTDTGVDVNHPDLAGRIWTNGGEIPGNGVDDDGNGLIDDVHGWDFASSDGSVFDGGDDESHGTHVAGTIAASANNGVGVAGVAPNARIMPLKFISGGVGYTSNAIAAINYAADHGATVINASWGGGSHSQPLCDAISQVSARGVTFVAAAGNSAVNTDFTPTAPASCTEATQITVASTNHADQLSGFSNHGAATVDLGAPGETIISTIPCGYGYKSGTSMAAPHVAGVAAVIKGMRPGAAPAQIKDAIVGGATPTAALAGRTASGGRLNLAGAVSRVTGLPVAPAPGTDAADPSTGTDAGQGTDAGAGTVSLALRAKAARGSIALRLTSSTAGRATVTLNRGRRSLGRFNVRTREGLATITVPARIARRAARGGVLKITATQAGARARTNVRVRPFAIVRSSKLSGGRGTVGVRLSRASRLNVAITRGKKTVATFRARGKRGVNKIAIPARAAKKMAKSGRYTLVIQASSQRTAVKGMRVRSR